MCYLRQLSIEGHIHLVKASFPAVLTAHMQKVNVKYLNFHKNLYNAPTAFIKRPYSLCANKIKICTQKYLHYSQGASRFQPGTLKVSVPCSSELEMLLQVGSLRVQFSRNLFVALTEVLQNRFTHNHTKQIS